MLVRTMAQQDADKLRSLKQQARQWFEQTQHTLESRIFPGESEVSEIARSSTALMGLSTLWDVQLEWPTELDRSLAALDLRRQQSGADRAIVVVGEERPVDVPAADLSEGHVAFVTLRHLAVALSGQLRSATEAVAAEDAFPFSATLEDGQHVALIPWIDAQIDEHEAPYLLIADAPPQFEMTLCRQLQRRRRARVLLDPDRTRIVAPPPKQRVPLLDRTDWLVLVWRESDGRIAVDSSRLGRMRSAQHVQLQTPSTEELLHVLPIELRCLAPVLELDRPLRLGLTDPESTRSGLGALRERQHTDTTMLVLSTYFDRLTDWIPALSHRQLTRAVFRNALLRESMIAWRSEYRVLLDQGYMTVDANEARATITSPLLRDYLAAHGLVRAVRDGDLDIVQRHSFPEDYVLRFARVIAPDLAEHFAKDRIELMRRTIASAVEREVQLKLAHLVNRAVGALEANLNEFIDRTHAESVEDAATPLKRVRDELDFLRNITERSRMLSDSHAWELAAVDLVATARAAAQPLLVRDATLEVTFIGPATLHAKAEQDALREILHNLIENAMHAVLSLAPEQRKIVVDIQRVGDVAEVRVRDSGCGVRAEDRERIFNDYVTTKKGGAGKPRGTGLGLSIARTFAERMGGHVALEASNGSPDETVFLLRLVAAD